MFLKFSSVPLLVACNVPLKILLRAVFRGAGGATAPPDVFDLLQNTETNLQNYWAYKLGWMSSIA